MFSLSCLVMYLTTVISSLSLTMHARVRRIWITCRNSVHTNNSSLLKVLQIIQKYNLLLPSLVLPVIDNYVAQFQTVFFFILNHDIFLTLGKYLLYLYFIYINILPMYLVIFIDPGSHIVCTAIYLLSFNLILLKATS